MYTSVNNYGIAGLHVISRTQGNPPIYYYRYWDSVTSSWNAWTKIPLDIVSDQLLPIVWNNRLYLFWTIINRKPDKIQNVQSGSDAMGSTPPPDVNSHLEIQLAWSEFKGNKWLAKQIAPQLIVYREPNDETGKTTQVDPCQVVLRSTILDPLLHIDIFVSPTFHSTPQHYAGFVLGGVGNTVEAFLKDAVGLIDQVGPETRNIGVFSGWDLGSLCNIFGSDYDSMVIVPKDPQASPSDPTRQRVQTCYVMSGTPLQFEPLLGEADYYRLLIPHQILDFDSSLPFFYEDNLRSYFMLPVITANIPSIWYTFIPFYHAFVPLFMQQINLVNGLDKLFSRQLQLNPEKIQGGQGFDFNAYYKPCLLLGNPPAEGVDFDANAGYSIYNWELFFHAPFQIAESLSLNQRFEDAKHWYEYIFNPTINTTDDLANSNTQDLSPTRCYWITKPFYLMNQSDYQNQIIQSLMDSVNTNDSNTINEVEVWRNDPVDPHAIAQLRQVAYQRTIVMKYIDNLIAWGDQLFSQDTMESVNEATQMYVLASELVGPRPELIKPLVTSPDQTYAELESKLDAFSNASVLAAENLLGPIQDNSIIDYQITSSSASTGSAQGSMPVNSSIPNIPSLYTLYFSITPNDQLLGYWDTVADRLFKIRHGMNIEGIKRQLALFAPPINPALLVRAAAAGIDLSSILNDTSAALPPYRFRIMVREAIELCEMVRGFGNELLSALEKRDAEALALLRSGYEKKIQDQINSVLQRRLDEATQEIEVITNQRSAILERQSFYSQRKDELTNDWEAAALVAQGGALITDAAAMVLDTISSIAHYVPDAQFGSSGAGGSPHVTAKWGGPNVGHGSSSAALALRIASAILHTTAQMSQTLGSYQRRKDDWGLQYNIATDELAANDAQMLAAQIRQDIAQKELDNHATNIQMASDVNDFMHNKYTNQDLYEWMISQISATYFQAYQLVYIVAKRAETCFQRELGQSDSSYIQFGYWDSLKKGLLAGDKLLYDLQRLKTAYYAQNVRELELTKHISLLSIDPYALVKLRSTGKCTINLPEILFDLDNPGHYMRRIKSVGVTVPCVVGPYTTVSMKLTLQDNYVRINPNSSKYDYTPASQNDPTIFFKDQGGVNSIVTSSAQNDRGLFELRFEDDRYLPFECAGAISSWDLELNPVYPQFDYNTISDVIIHMQYTARNGGDPLRAKAVPEVISTINQIALAESRNGLYNFINLRQQFGSEWYKFQNPAGGQDPSLTLNLSPALFPFFTNGLNIKLKGMDVVARIPGSGTYYLNVTKPGDTDPLTITLQGQPTSNIPILLDPDLNNSLYHSQIENLDVDIVSASTPISNFTWNFKLKDATTKKFIDDVDELFFVVHYDVS
jgi:Tc toxin complex TcA C-terminal TcB-binding domain/Neuraminidase-like domain